MNVVVIGAGANERVAARLLAAKGHDIAVIDDRRPVDETGWVSPAIEKALGISVAHEWPDPWASGGGLELWRDMQRSSAAIRALSARDAERWPAFCTRMARLAQLFERLYLAPPADPTGVGMALAVRRLGREGMEDLMRIVPMSVAELLDDWFECEPLKALLAAQALRHVVQGPRSGGTAFCLLHAQVGAPPGVFRGPRSNLCSVLEIDVRKAEIRTIRVEKGRVTGVALADGSMLPAATVVSGLHPRRTLLELCDPGWLDPELARALRHIRSRRFEVLLNEASLDDLERRYDDVKHGRAPTVGGEAELALDQALWMRPLPELAGYRTPIEGLWLCGESMHPGPGIAGAAGYNCAREILKST
ncbi:MAG TPA: hypothetical protein VD965_03940 [Burkholderiales bacterium]|nr:hypothetical protein [Burkholderiales bacterium]